MAVIPKYFSESATTPAINQVKMDPQTAAAPYTAAAQATGNVMNVIQGEMGQWTHLLHQKQQEQKAAAAKQAKIQDSLYQAQAGAQLSMGANQIAHQALAQHTGDVSQTSNYADQEFQKIADQMIAGAPSTNAQMALLKKSISSRAGLYNHVTNSAVKQSNQMNMDKIEGLLKQSEGYVASNPDALDQVKQGTSEIFKSMESLGIPKAKRDEIFNKFNMNLEYSAIRSKIDKDPISSAQELADGKFAFLGATQVRQLNGIIQSRSNAMTSAAKSDMNDLQDRLVSGLPVPEDAATKIQNAQRFGLQDHVSTVDRLMKLSQDAGSLPADDLEQAAARLKIEAAQGKFETTPKDIDTLTKFLQGNAKAQREDPVQYAQVRGNINELAPIADLGSISPQQIEDRRLRALQIREQYKVEAPMLSKAEADGIAHQMANSDPETLVQNFQTTSLFDRNSRTMLANKLEKGSPAISSLLMNPSVDRPTTDAILRGYGMLTSGQVKVKAEMDSTAELDYIYMDRPELRKNVIQAAKSLAAFEKAPDVTGDHVARAANLISVNNPGMFNFGSYSTVAPEPGMNNKSFDKFVDDKLSEAGPWLDKGTGVPANTSDGSPVDFKKLSPSSFQYYYDSDGMYSVRYKDKVVTTAEGKPVRIDLQGLRSKD